MSAGNPDAAAILEGRRRITPELLRKYDRPGPRYTSYPTAPMFHEGFGHDAYAAKLREANAERDAPLSLYAHIPFCEERCLFCGCNVVITRKYHVAEGYLDYLHRELEMVAAHLPDRRTVAQFHWGGGTPTYLKPAEIEALFRAFTREFTLLPGAEVAIEVDPRVTTDAQLDTLARLGFNRLSMGIQDFTLEVQEAVHRIQGEELTRAIVEKSRALGFASVNVDLIYGLPLQRIETFRETLRSVIAMRPDRVAVYSYAHVPWLKKQQTKIDAGVLPKAELKFELFHAALEAFLAAGYEQIGMDHFALPEDEMSRARRTGTLHRNFMGYTVKPANDMIGFGVSAIGDVQRAYAQNEVKLSRYYEALEAGRLPVHRGYFLSEDDAIRRYVITQLMCNFLVRFDELERRFGVRYDEYFRAEDESLRDEIGAGFLVKEEGALRVTPVGQVFIRNIAMVFDRYLRPGEKGDASKKPIYSRTI